MSKNSFILFALFIAIISCKDDNNDNLPGDNQYRMYGINYDLSSGILWHEIPGNVVDLTTETLYDNYSRVKKTSDGRDTVIYYRDTVEVPSADVKNQVTGKFVISLYGDGANFDPEEERTVGVANVLTFHLSVPEDEFKAGKYTFATSNAANTFYGYACSEYDFNKKTGPANPIDTGEINISVAGDIYEIQFDCKTTSNQTLKGSYQGTLRQVDNRKNSLVEVKDMVLEGLPDTAYDYRYWNNPPDFQAYPYDRYAKVLGLSSTGLTFGFYSGYYQVTDKKNVDLAYCNYYKTKDKYCFISPVYLRLYMDHQLTPQNHTKFINDVATSGIKFTVADFDNLTLSDGPVFRPFDIIPDKKEIDVNAPLPRIVLFQNSNGMKGAIKIKEIVPVGLVEKLFQNEYTYEFVKKIVPGGGYVKFDVKVQKNSAAESIK